MSKFFLDSGVLVDFLDRQSLKHKSAIALVAQILKDGHKIVLSQSSIKDIICACPKGAAFDKLISATYDFTLNSSIIIADYDVWVIRASCSAYLKNGGDIRSYLQYFCAEKQGCVAIYTCDKDFINLKILIWRY